MLAENTPSHGIKKFHRKGTIVRVKLHNFMTYDDVEMFPGCVNSTRKKSVPASSRPSSSNHRRGRAEPAPVLSLQTPDELCHWGQRHWQEFNRVRVVCGPQRQSQGRTLPQPLPDAAWLRATFLTCPLCSCSAVPRRRIPLSSRGRSRVSLRSSSLIRKTPTGLCSAPSPQMPTQRPGS